MLEVGCGVGIYSNNFGDWVGIDISETALAVNKDKSVVQASALKLPFKSECFSLVMMFDTIEHLPDPESALMEAIRVLSSGGFLAVGSPPLVWELLLTGEPSNLRRKQISELNRITGVDIGKNGRNPSSPY